MVKPKRNDPLQIVEYYEWFLAQKFENPEVHAKYVPVEERNFLMDVIFPMFYDLYNLDSFKYKTCTPVPYVLKDFSSKKPKYVINNDKFTLIFFKYETYSGKFCWEVSFHVKDHSYCDNRITSFKRWYFRYYWLYYGNMGMELAEMPRFFKYPRLKFGSTKVEDFCIEFWNSDRDVLLFELCNHLRFF